MIVSRTCTEISPGDADQYREKVSQPLEAFRDTPAYVLLGDPGAGKTTAFEAECEVLGEQACPITARDFLTFDLQEHPEWRGKMLFIDGLDEVRAGASDARTPFDAIRGRLDALGRPRFRLSCREADWLAANDRRHLEAVSPDAKVTVLRLNPLTDSDIEQLLKDNPRVDDAKAFMEEANRRGIGDLLRNPQTLDLLARAVAGGDWPESRKETFEMACGQMAEEHNPEHQTASAPSNPPTPENLLDAAGRLCTVHLIAGKAGYTLHGEPDDEYPALNRCEYARPERLRLVSDRKLFKGVGVSDNRFAPIHRQVAEFLSARHLARIIHDGLPARRVIALMTGEDGAVVTEMRGLSAWLAAHSQEARMDLIERDPIGVGLYGDIRGFSFDEKRALLSSLGREGVRIDPWFDPQAPRDVSWMSPFQERDVAFGALATPDMQPALRAILEEGNRDLDHQVVADFMLHILRHGAPLPNLSKTLLDIVRGDTWLPHINGAALRAFIHTCPDGPEKTGALKKLLADIQTGSVPDSDDNMLFGILITALYPDEISPSQIWNYFPRQEDPESIGKLWLLWEIVRNASDEHVAEFLDDLHRRFAELRPALERHHAGHLPLTLLARGLKAYGDQLDTACLYDWLGTGELAYDRDFGEDAQDIRSWLEQRPEVQKAIVLEGLDRCPDATVHIRKRLYHTNPPPDFGPWCLKQAVAKASTKPRIAERLLEMVLPWIGNGDLSLEVIQNCVQKNERLEAALDEWVASRARREKDEQEWERTFTEERRQQEEEGLAYVRSNEAALRENRASPSLLHQLAVAYFRGVPTSKGLKTVAEWLQGDQHLIQVVLQGFRGVVERQDVPAFEEILSIRAQGRMHSLAWPFLAGLAEIERVAPKDAARWDDDRIRKALAFYYGCGEPSLDGPPVWYQRLLAARPELVAEVLVACDAAEFRRRQEHLLNFSHMNKIWEPDHARVVRHASLPLLSAFPTRCKLAHVGTLVNLLWAATRYADREQLQELIERKASRTSMNVAQRVHWLAAGFSGVVRSVQGQAEQLRAGSGEAHPSSGKLLAPCSRSILGQCPGNSRTDLSRPTCRSPCPPRGHTAREIQ